MNRFFLILDIEFHPEKGTEGTCFHGHANAKENLPSVLSVVSHVETENQSYSLVISLDVVLSLLIFEFLLEKERENFPAQLIMAIMVISFVSS